MSNEITDKRLSDNFWLNEFLFSETAARHGHPLVPDKKQVNYLVQLVRMTLQPIRNLLQRPVVITSGYRDEWLNTMIGGSQNSQHMKGQAADFIVPGMTPHQVCEKIVEAGIPFDQLISEFGQWTHISNVPGPAIRREVLTARSMDGTTTYYRGLVA